MTASRLPPEPGFVRGLQRLAIAILVPWAIGWGVVYWVNTQTARAATTETAEETTCEQLGECANPYAQTVTKLAIEQLGAMQVRANEEAYLRKLDARRDAAHDWTVRAMWFGVGGLALVPLSVIALLWVWRGFQTKAPSDPT
ncbi:MAG TPA: hypothetical protein VGI95_17085 [Caulobacteraceae bacterium]|jgi:hypothetical protein